MNYESFSLRIEPGPGSSYAVSVQSPQGEGQGEFQIPEAPARSAGQELFRALFRGEAASLFHASLGSLREPHQGLRINIAIDPRRPELAPLQKLPWERLCRPETEDFLCLSRRTPVIRSLDAHRERRSAIARPRRLRILVVAASPMDGPALDVAQELAHLKAAWKDQEKSVEIVFLKRGGVEEMRQAFLEEPFHILHFMGHGELDAETGEGVLFFERHDGTGQGKHEGDGGCGHGIPLQHTGVRRPRTARAVIFAPRSAFREDPDGVRTGDQTRRCGTTRTPLP